MLVRRLADVISQLFGVRTAPRLNHYGNVVNQAVTQILQDDPRRMGVTICNNSVNSVFISPNPDVSTTKGISVGAGGGKAILNWQQDFELVSHAWYAIASVDNSAVTVLENRLQGEAPKEKQQER